jgi:hypothetical protein
VANAQVHPAPAGTGRVGAPAGGADVTGLEEAIAALGSAVDAVVGADLDAHDDDQLRRCATAVQAAVSRLTAERTRLLGALETRAVRRAGPGRERPALRAVHDGLADDLNLPVSEVKRDGRTGRRLAEQPEAQRAMSSGGLSGPHATVLAETLEMLDDPVARETAEGRLLEVAATQDVREFARTARALVVELDADAAQRRIDRQHARRSLRTPVASDGTLHLSGNGGGLDAELVQAAIHAFRGPDPAGVVRNAGQRTWDALVLVCRAALDAGAASTDRKVRPHILVTVAEPVVADRDGTGNGLAETPWSGPLPWTEVRRLLADASVSRVLVDAAGLPLEASVGVRAVPAAVRKGVLVRDKVCIGDRCEVPAAWCDMMHLDTPYRFEGRLTMATGGLGCRTHHRMFDHGKLELAIVEGRPVLHHPGRPPRATRRARAGPDPPSG